jgi:Phage-related lysozyme (muraminidase)
MRLPIKIIGASAAVLVSIATWEGYRDKAYIPVAGDVPTLGFGSTKNVRMGDTTTPDRALVSLLNDINTHSAGIKSCIKVPLYQHEFDAYSSFAFNVGVGAFCKSTLVKKLNAGDYTGACNELSRWVYSGGVKYNGLVKRREQERKLCLSL